MTEHNGFHDPDRPQTRFFGHPSMRKDDEVMIPTPVGELCELCEEQVQPGDVGTINGAGQVIHYECMLRAVIGSVGHQRGRCSCFGGTEEDPPGMTLRQAAIAAAALFHDNGVIGPRRS